MSLLHVGLLINPLAGLGGALALKGSDGEVLRERLDALTDEQKTRASARVERALGVLGGAAERVHFSTWGGAMGAEQLASLDLQAEVLGEPLEVPSSPADTRGAAGALVESGIDILLFAGGDGTARDILDAVGHRVPVLGIPAGVKMHSGVFAVSPEAAGELLRLLAQGGLVDLRAAEVRDIDEEAFRRDVVKSRFYGEMQVPAIGQYLQQTKVGGREDPELAAAEIAAWFVEQMQQGRTYLLGPGSTTAAIMAELGLPGTLLGVDVVRDRELLLADGNEEQLLQQVAAAPEGADIVVTAIGGQGHVFGRGNQQFSPAVIRAVGLANIIIVAAKSKVGALEGRPLLVDTNDASLDRELYGYHTVITGYDDRILYRVGDAWQED